MKRIGIALLVLLLAPFSNAQFRYGIRIIGQHDKVPYFEGARMNNSAQVAGFWSPENNKMYAARWTDGKIDTFYGQEGRNTLANGINEDGDLVGFSGSGPQGSISAAMWTAGGEYQELPGLFDGAWSEAKAINDKGWAVGWSDTLDHRSAPVLWRNGQALDLGQANEGFELSEAVAINNDGLVVGFEQKLPEGPYAAWYWTEAGGIKPMFSKDKQWMTPADVNEGGYVTGLGGYIWKDGQVVKMLEGAWGGYRINSSNDVLGYLKKDGKMVVWRDDEILDIQALMDPSYGFNLYSIADLNDAGQILGVGKRADGTYATILLTPVPEPASMLALGAGGLCMALRRRGGPCKGKIAYPKQLALGDSSYLGNGFLSLGNSCTQFLTLKASGFDYQTFKVYLEQKASRSLNFTLKARNYDTQQYDTLGTGTVSTTEIGQEFAATEVLPPGRQPYVDPVTREVKLQIGYSDTSGGFSVFLDRVEVRSR